MKHYIRLIRPHQWIKNGFVLVPAFFAAKIGILLTDPKPWIAVISFSLIASSVYILNDILDVEKDRLHEVKRTRPLASGDIAIKNAVLLMIVLLSVGGAMAFAVDRRFVIIIFGYFVLNALYSSILKNISLIDIAVIAFGFILRILAGGIAADVPISKWLILMTFLLACCLALGKRRDDLLMDVDKTSLRPSLSGYTVPFVDTCLVVLAGTTIVCYIMYTVSEDVVQRLHSDQVYLTSFFVILGMLRYLQIAIVEQKSGSPTLILLKDTMIQVMIGLWIVAFFVIIYAT